MADAKRKAEEEAAGRRSIRRKTEDAKALDSAIVEVTVANGDSNQTFHAHHDLLIKHSEFFKTAMNGRWLESKTGRVPLPDATPETFAIFHRFIYRGCVFITEPGDCSGIKDSKGNFADNEWGRLYNAFKLGQMLLSASFKDAVVDAMVDKMMAEDRFPLALHTEIWPVSSKKSAVRGLVTDVGVWICDLGRITQEEIEKVDGSFAASLVMAMMPGNQHKVGTAQTRFERCACKYHEHVVEGMACYKTMF